ncbi:MAG TPA: amidase [Xanthobacteraceae bacterium]|nr:amidase [Xanthobacteraceae bacterium]
MIQEFAAGTKSFLVLREAFLDGSADPRELLEVYLERIADRDKSIGAFVTLAVDQARQSADAATKRYRSGRPASLVDGLPVGLKDNLETRDMPTGFGSPLFTGWCGGRDSAAAYALRRAGAVIVGKLTTTEFAGSVVTAATRNPHDLSRTPGGSSSGPAAAVASGMLPVALGTQVIGSIIRPASFCGVFGFKPTYGSLNRAASGDIYSQNCIGTLSSRLESAYLVCHAIAEFVGGDPGYLPFQGGPFVSPAIRPRALAILETAGWASADSAAKDQFEIAIGRLSAAGVRFLTRRTSALVAYLEEIIRDAREVARQICAYEAVWPYGEISERDPANFSSAMQERIDTAARMSREDYAQLLLRRDQMSAAYAMLASEIDAYVTLSALGAAPVGLSSSGDPAFAVPFTTIRAPSLSLPLLTVDGLPLGLQIAGFAHREQVLSGVATYIADVLH